MGMGVMTEAAQIGFKVCSTSMATLTWLKEEIFRVPGKCLAGCVIYLLAGRH